MTRALQNNPDQDQSILTLERIFTQKEFDTKSFGPIHWLEDDSGYLVLETADSKTKDDPPLQKIAHYDLDNDQRHVLVTAGQLTPEGAEKPLKIANFHWSEKAQRFLIFTNTKRVWRANTRGDYWLLDINDGRLHQLGGDMPASSLMFAKISPDGRSVAYVHQNNIYVETVEGGQISQLTTDGSADGSADGSDTIINGTSDWVYEEELHLRDCFLWSPDGQHIAYWQFDSSEVGAFNLINNTDSLYPKLIPIPYPKVGSPNPACRVGVISAVGGDTTWFNLSNNSRNHYIHQMFWCQNSAELVIQQTNRLQNCNQIIFGNISDGSIKVVLTEQDDTWVDLHDGLKMVNEEQAFTWLSDQDGWRHLYLVSRDGRTKQQLTFGDFDVIDVQAIDKTNGWLYFRASPDNPTQRYLYRTSLNDSDQQIQRVTPANQPGTHSYQLSPGAKWAIHSYTTFDRPPVLSLISLPDHQLVKVLQGNDQIHQKVAALSHQPVEFFKVPIAPDVVLDAWCMKPADFDPGRKYPVLFYIYGEPSGLTVLDTWAASRQLWHQHLVQQGFIVMSVESSGTPSPRGRSWRKSMYRQVGTKSAADQAAALQVILKERPYLDPDRVGVWGWSGGGTMTLNLLFRYPDLYKTGVAVAAVSDQRLYDTIYQERYMGLPDDNEAAYIEGSPITHAHNLAGNLLLIHGTGDDNVHYQCFERLVNELIKHNKRFDMMAYPNRTHGIREGKNTSLHLHDLMTCYLTQHL